MTNQGLTYQTSEGYYAYGPGALRARSGNIPLTDHKFTGQKRDGTGLQYYNARYYDPDLGQFLSPDTLVPDPTNVFAWNRYMYTIGNPMRYTDPSGHDLKDVITTFVDFAQGVGAQVGYNNTVIALPSEVNSLAPQSGESTAMQAGRFIGNVVTAVQGVAEISGGAGLGSAGVAACTTGVGCVATAPAVIGASAVIAHGGTVATIGAVSAGAQLANAVMAMMGEDDNAQRIRSTEKSIRSLKNRVAEHEKKLQDYIQNPDAFDNQGLLKNAPSEQIRQNIIQGRVNHLTSEIQGWREQISKLQQQLSELR